MSRPRNPVPTYRLHRQSGQAVTTLRLPDGTRRDVLLGVYGTPESKEEYRRVLAEFEVKGGRPPTSSAALTVAEVLVAYWQFAMSYYKHPDGRETSELNCLRAALRPLKNLYSHSPAAEFSPLALKVAREEMIKAGWCRAAINRHVHRIRRVFRWAVAEGLVPASVYHGLQAVTALARGRSLARESEAVKPVADGFVDALRPFVLPEVWAMIELQRLSGARPGEICQLRGCDLDVSGPVWIFRPASHKTLWRNKDRTIALGPRGQAVVRPFLQLDTQAFLFSPRRAMEARAERLRAARKTRVQPSQHDRRKYSPRKRPGERYTTESFAKAVAVACTKADRLARQQRENARAAAECRPAVEVPADVPAAERLIVHWHPHQLRHSFASLVRREFGLESAGAALGHSKMSATEVYAERDFGLAIKVASQVG